MNRPNPLVDFLVNVVDVSLQVFAAIGFAVSSLAVLDWLFR